MRVGIIAILQESNTFLSRPTSLNNFREDLLATGRDVRSALANAHHEVGGFFHELEDHAIEAVGVLAARALPYGVITTTTAKTLMDLLDDSLAAAGKLDGVLVAPHGATVSEDQPDFDGYWLTRLRKHLGPDKPIIGTLDPHANLSLAMVESCQALVAYRTNPHTDQRARGIEAAALMARTLRGDIRPVQRAVFPPLAINIERQATSTDPCNHLLCASSDLRKRAGILSSSVFLGFPYADVAEMGASALVVADRDASLAQRCADKLGALMWQRRSEFVGRLLDVPAALAEAEQLAGPVGLLDMGDNVGGGSPGDSTILAHALLARRRGPAFVCLYDPESVVAARTAGVGGKLPLDIGGKSDNRHGFPISANVRVVSLAGGAWSESEPRHGGFTHFDQGPTAVVTVDDLLTIMLTSRRMAPFSLRQLTCNGIDPAAFRFLIVKGVHAPVAAYESVCKHFIRVDTPGVTTADFSSLPYQHRRRPMFPFESDVQWAPPTDSETCT